VFSDVDTVSRYVFALFHGIISAYIAYVLADISVSEAYFVILVLFCSVLNVFIFRLLRICFLWIRAQWLLSLQPKDKSKALEAKQELTSSLKDIFTTTGLFPATRSLLEIVSYVAIAIIVGFSVANAYEHNWILRTADYTANWPKASDKNPLDQFLQQYHEGKRNFGAETTISGYDWYIKIFWNGDKNSVEGHLYAGPEGSGLRYAYLSPACEIVKATQPDSPELAIPIAGPGAIVNLDNTNINHIDIIDIQESACFLTTERQRQYVEFLGHLARFFSMNWLNRWPPN
jgi:hypothetical protein